MRPHLLWMSLILLLGAPWAGHSQGTDPRSSALAHHLSEAMGGMEAFNAPRYLLFRFVVERGGESVADYSHAWDRVTGDYRLTGKTEDGQDFISLFNINTPEEGVAWVRGKQLDGDALTLMLRRNYRRHINDAYWLLMPWKWLDPGVHLLYQEQTSVNGKTYDVVKLTFNHGVGLTSEDTYWGYISRKTRLMEHWGFILEDSEATEPLMWTWENWEDAGGGVLFSKRKYNKERDLAILFPEAKLTDLVPASLFRKP